MMKFIGIIILIFIVAAVFLAPSEEEKRIEASTFPTSSATYNELNKEVGCDSKYSDEKKTDIFNSKYKNHWMTWSGEILLLEADNAALNIDSVGIQDLQITFDDKKAGYDLKIGDTIKVKFVMKYAGGCFLAFSGELASIVK
jgi:hypothetical protein